MAELAHRDFLSKLPSKMPAGRMTRSQARP